MTADRYRDAHAQPPGAVTVVPLAPDHLLIAPSEVGAVNAELAALRAEVERLRIALCAANEGAERHHLRAEAAEKRIADLETILTRIEENLRIGAEPLVALVNDHGDRKHKEAWRFAIYASAIRAQVAVGDERMAEIRNDAVTGSMRTADHSVASNEMVERVARAIHQANGYTAPSWEHVSTSQEHYRSLARAAIGAMGEGTK